MEFNVDIDAEKVNRMVADAVLESVIGEQLKKAILKEVGRLSSTYHNPLEPVIQAEVQRILFVIIQDEYEEAIKEAVREQMTDEMVRKTVRAALDAYMDMEKRL